MLTLNLSLKNYDRKPSILSDMFSNNYADYVLNVSDYY